MINKRKLNLNEVQALHVNAVYGATSIVTHREATGDKSVTLDKNEQEVLFLNVSPSRIARKGGYSLNVNPSAHEFMIWETSEQNFLPAHISVTYPKKDKNELRLYFKKNVGLKTNGTEKFNFYPTAGQNFYILKIDDDERPYIGALDNAIFESIVSKKLEDRSYAKGRTIDLADEEYQHSVHSLIEPMARKQRTTSGYDRKASIGKGVLKAANYKCQYNSEHRTFTVGINGNQYMEAHHLIPISFQNRYLNNSLDTNANIISLCPNCHRAVHYGDIKTKKDMLKKFFIERELALKADGISESLETLYEKYGIT